MPANWFNISACEGDEYKKSICADKRPYFMKYARPDYSAKYNTFIKNEQMRCNIKFHMPVKELLDKYFNGEIIGETEEEKEQLEFVRWFIAKSPLGTGACSMNKICWHIEEKLDPYKIELHATSGFDYTKLKVKRRCTNEHREQLKDAYNYYMERMKVIAKDSSIGKIDMSEYVREHDFMVRNVRERIEGLCPSEEERLNIILDMRYKDNCNQGFMWSMVGSLICDRLAELEREGELA